jgi:DNA mismatch repair protein PMS2
MTGRVQQIDSASVHRICSGQVVVDLATATKELLENSLDAGATNITIKFKNYGIDQIQVIDDGSGIAPEDYDSICIISLLEADSGRKYHTSKLTSFENLDDLQTFGFRGEALSSLCALADIQIITTTREQVPLATTLDFNNVGEIISKKVSPGKV